MIVRRVEIGNFRRIRKLDWNLAGMLVCLVGPGDSGKSTILEAIERALSPGDPVFSEVDLPDLRLGNDEVTRVSVTVGDLPPELIHDSRFGHYLRGWSPDTGLQDEPIPEHPDWSVLTVRLTVGPDLDPAWEAFTERGSKPIGQRDRARLGMGRIGANAAWHLTWSKRSALARAVGDEPVQPVLTEALRTVREEFARARPKVLTDQAEAVAEQATRLGARPVAGLFPSLSPASLSISQGALALHDGQIPVSSAGMGTQRLTAIAAQQTTVPAGAVLLLDELEAGLEPHRVRHLIRYLRSDAHVGQVILTTHSPVAVSEFDCQELAIVRPAPHETSVLQPARDLQATIRGAAEALLSPSVIVCEGKTEVGLCRGWDEAIWTPQGLPGLAVHGCAVVEGGGDTQAPTRALDLTALGYRVLLLLDGDREEALPAGLAQAGVTVIQWSRPLSTEQVLANELPLQHLQLVTDFAIAEAGETPVSDAIRARLEISNDHPFDVHALAAWPRGRVEEAELRSAVGEAAKRKRWFKQIAPGEELGRLSARALPEMPDSELARAEEAVRRFAYGV